MTEMTVPQCRIQGESGDKVCIIGKGDYSTIQTSTSVRNRSSEEESVKTMEERGVFANIYTIVLVLRQVQNRKEVRTKVWDMQNIMKLQQALRLVIYEGEKTYRTYSYRVNDLVVCKTNGTFQRGVRREPMAMGGLCGKWHLCQQSSQYLHPVEGSDPALHISLFLFLSYLFLICLF